METTVLYETLTASFFAGALVMWGVVFYFQRRARRRYLSEWLLTWTLLLLAYVAFALALDTERSLFGYLFSFGIIASGFFFQKGVHAYGDIPFRRRWTFVLVAFFLLILSQPVLDYSLTIFQQMVYTFSAFFFAVAGLQLLRTSDTIIRAHGMFYLLFGVHLALFPLILRSGLFIPYGMTLSAFMGLALSASMLYLHFRIEMHRQTLEKERLQYLSFHDKLTSLKNRAYLEEYIQPAYDSYAQPCMVMFIDMNNLKDINDTYGHSVGDKLLVRTAETLAELVNDDDILLRYGGDEFVIVRPDADEHANETFLKELSRHMDEQKEPIPLSLAVGKATRKKGESVATLIEMAERHMYKDKHATQHRKRKITV